MNIFTEQSSDSGVIANLSTQIFGKGFPNMLRAANLLRELVSEAGDLLFHLIVLLCYRRIAFDDIITELEERHRKQ